MRNDYQIRPRFDKGSKDPVGKNKNRMFKDAPKELSLEERIIRKIKEKSEKEEKK